ncbi:YiiX/YebB-like N1pC/P60 family cysteine hydrolase [Pseudoalteromonas aliena]|uniref:YiiX/YebB-like N1pC/P60 family cysteine hydrolase n=1 Tax=Pseudoalteromonas aliena TaxID=247523 RepID=UPI002494428E|nr:YiiX/YebB-like N1pC/P60 family cysteine hydrolase [Pseudoalteromonas aliena]
MFLLDRSKLKEGDILLTRSNKKNSKLICKITKSDFSHAILYVGESSYIHSDVDGVHSGNIQRLLIDETRFAKVVRIKDQVEIKNVINYARLQVGTSYSKISAANAYTKIFSKLDAKKQFCSRLVAKAYESAGIELVSNSDACLPQEIADSKFVYDVKDCVYKASEKEMEFALSYNPIEKQSEISNFILESARKLIGSNIQSFADITSALISDPTFDTEITKIYERSGYLNMWKYELNHNPWRYDRNLFENLPLSKTELNQQAIKELNYANSLLELYKTNLEQYFYLKEQYKLKYAEQQFSLYKQLVENALDHKFTAEAILNKT